MSSLECTALADRVAQELWRCRRPRGNNPYYLTYSHSKFLWKGQQSNYETNSWISPSPSSGTARRIQSYKLIYILEINQQCFSLWFYRCRRSVGLIRLRRSRRRDREVWQLLGHSCLLQLLRLLWSMRHRLRP